MFCSLDLDKYVCFFLVCVLFYACDDIAGVHLLLDPSICEVFNTTYWNQTYTIYTYIRKREREGGRERGKEGEVRRLHIHVYMYLSESHYNT